MYHQKKSCSLKHVSILCNWLMLKVTDFWFTMRVRKNGDREWSLCSNGLIKFAGEYFVVGVDIEQYDTSVPDKYLRGLLQDETDADCIEAFRSYFGIVPSAPLAFDTFARQVSRHLTHCNLSSNLTDDWIRSYFRWTNTWNCHHSIFLIRLDILEAKSRCVYKTETKTECQFYNLITARWCWLFPWNARGFCFFFFYCGIKLSCHLSKFFVLLSTLFAGYFVM